MYKINNKLLIFFFGYLFFMLGFFLNENSSGGALSDYNHHFKVILSFKENFLVFSGGAPAKKSHLAAERRFSGRKIFPAAERRFSGRKISPGLKPYVLLALGSGCWMVGWG